MTNYYSEKLSSEKLMCVYEIATPRVQQYLDAELEHVVKKIHASDSVLELGCGYGRIFPSLSKKSKTVSGIDTSFSSLQLGKEMFENISNCFFAQMNAVQLAFPDSTFDVVFGIQNGISAFHVNQLDLVRESIRVTKPNGVVLFSSYSEKFWKFRLEWFQLQSDAGLLGEIDYEKTHDGNIVCKDGFTATTVSAQSFHELTADIKNTSVKTEEVDDSSIFCEITKNY
ncbi:MAG: class I SAM-dependent methyltransferase [Bacteroidetes bacterium]|nr:class I SAM-dependent methyltransferase [Bacteroidota bacterium]